MVAVGIGVSMCGVWGVGGVGIDIAGTARVDVGRVVDYVVGDGVTGAAGGVYVGIHNVTM